MSGDIEQLNSDFIQNVLPHLFKNTALANARNNGSGFGTKGYYFYLTKNSFFKCAPEYLPTTRKAIHFTNIKALHSILNDFTVRMYSLTNMNDPNEFSFIASEFIENEFLLESYKKRIFILSLCDSEILNSDDILTLWRFYGQNGQGCAIEFEISDDVTSHKGAKLANVIYERPNYNEFFDKVKVFEDKHNQKVGFSQLIQLSASLHKKPYYKHEQEIRLILDDSSPDNVYETLKKDSNFGYDFTYGGQISSYYKLKLYQKTRLTPNIRISRIQFGFKHNSKMLEEYKNHIHDIFRGYNYRNEKTIELPKIEFSPLSNEFR